MPFLVLYYLQLGLVGAQIGVLRAVPPLVTMFSAPMWGAVADASGRHRALRLAAIGGAWLGVLALSMASSYPWLVFIVGLQAFFIAPVIPLVDSAVVTLLGKRRDAYGSQRLWGAVGWGLCGLLAGFVIERYGIAWAFIGYLGVSVGVVVTAVGIPVPQAARKAAARGDFTSDLRRLASHRSWLIFLLAVLIGGLYQALEMNYLMLYFEALGMPEFLMGLALVVGTLSEIPVWALAPRLLRRWGSRGLLSVAFVAAATKGLVYAFWPPVWLALGIQLLHGFSFPAMWAAGVAYASAVAPEGTQATAQGAFGGVYMGLCVALSAFFGGQLFGRLGIAQTFGVFALMPLLGLALVCLGVRRVET